MTLYKGYCLCFPWTDEVQSFKKLNVAIAKIRLIAPDFIDNRYTADFLLQSVFSNSEEPVLLTCARLLLSNGSARMCVLGTQWTDLAGLNVPLLKSNNMEAIELPKWKELIASAPRRRKRRKTIHLCMCGMEYCINSRGCHQSWRHGLGFALTLGTTRCPLHMIPTF